MYFCILMPQRFGLQFGKAIVCSDAAAEAARYVFTAVDRTEGFLVLAVASLGEELIEFKSIPEVLCVLVAKLKLLRYLPRPLRILHEWGRAQSLLKRSSPG